MKRGLLSGMLQREGVERFRFRAGLLQASLDWQLHNERALQRGIGPAVPLSDPRVAAHARSVLHAATGRLCAVGLVDLMSDLALGFAPALRDAATRSAHREVGDRVLADMAAHAAAREHRIAAECAEVERRARAAHAVPGVAGRAASALQFSMGTLKGNLSDAKFHGHSQGYKCEAALVPARRAVAQDFGPEVRPACCLRCRKQHALMQRLRARRPPSRRSSCLRSARRATTSPAGTRAWAPISPFSA